MKGGVSAFAFAALLCLAGGASGAATTTESPPEQGTRLHFRKTLFIHNSALGRVLAESRRNEKDSSLSTILTTDYGLSEESLPPLREAFRELNPGVDPSHIPAGRTVRVPFRIEEGLAGPTRSTAAPSPAEPAPAPSAEKYAVRPGDSLWRILKSRFRIKREDIAGTVAAVAKANPGIRDLNHLVAGQTLVVPVPGAGASLPGEAAPRPASNSASRSLLTLLGELGCQVSSTGQAFLPVARGRTIRLDSRDFPVVSGPSGRKVILDPSSRLSPALARSLEEAWNYTVIQGTEPDEEALLEKVLPKLGFHEVAEGPKTVSLARGVDLIAEARWTIAPREEDLWEGRVHFVFPAKAVVSPNLLSLASRAGYSVHVLRGANAVAPATSSGPGVPARVPEIPMSDPALGEAVLLKTLGVPHRVRPEVECNLEGGVLYRLRPEITFDHGGTSYAVPPPEPRRAEALLTRAGYFTILLSESSSPLDRLADLLALLQATPRRLTVETPEGQSLRLRLKGLSVDVPGLAARLYPGVAIREGTRVLLTASEISPEVASLLLKEGYSPWMVRNPRSATATRP